MGNTRSAEQVRWDAKVPGAIASTASPTESPETPAPSATMRPAHSLPNCKGVASSLWSLGITPSASNTSRKLRPAASTAISTSPAEGGRRVVARSRSRSRSPTASRASRNGRPLAGSVFSGVVDSVARRPIRATLRWPSRSATSSSVSSASSSARRVSISPGRCLGSRSSWMQRSSGCSSAIVRPIPKMGACWTATGATETACAPRVSSHSRGASRYAIATSACTVWSKVEHNRSERVIGRSPAASSASSVLARWTTAVGACPWKAVCSSSLHESIVLGIWVTLSTA